MTWPPDVPFSARLATLLVLLIMGAAIDVAVRGREATRPREYAFLLAAGAIGALFALCVDQVTSRLSPEYFVIGKGLDEGPTFARAVVELGLQAGLVAGLVLGGVLLLANQAKPDRPALPLLRVLLRAGWPLGGALLVAPIGALTGVALFPGGMRGELARLLDAEPLERFLRVWGVHLGLYVGAVAGVIVAVVDVRRRRRAMSVVVLAACLSGCATPGEEMEERVARLHARGSRRRVSHARAGASDRPRHAPPRRPTSTPARSWRWSTRAPTRGGTTRLPGRRAASGRMMRRSIAAGDARGLESAARLLRDGDEPAVHMATEWLRLAAATGLDEARAAFDVALHERPELRRVEDESLLPAMVAERPTTPTERVAEWSPVLPTVAPTDRLVDGVRHFEEGRPDDARAVALAALRAKRDDAHALVLLAACDLTRARETPTLGWAHLARAKVSLERAREVEPTDASVWAALATVCMWDALGRSERGGGAVSAAETAAYLDASHASLAARVRARVKEAPWDPREQIAWLLLRRRSTRSTLEEREADVELALHHSPGNQWALGARGYLRAARGVRST